MFGRSREQLPRCQEASVDAAYMAHRPDVAGEAVLLQERYGR